MIAYKFLRREGVAPFTGFRWSPDTWVSGGPGPLVCGQGVHACRVDQLPYWVNRELWEIELAGEIVEGTYKLAAQEGRLVRMVDTWDEAAQIELGRACAGRIRELVPPGAGGPELDALGADLDRLAAAGKAASACYIAAVIAERAGGTEARRAERSLQAAWFAEHVL